MFKHLIAFLTIVSWIEACGPQTKVGKYRCEGRYNALFVNQKEDCAYCSDFAYDISKSETGATCCNNQLLVFSKDACGQCGQYAYDKTDHFCMDPARSRLIPLSEKGDIKYCKWLDHRQPYLDSREQCCRPIYYFGTRRAYEQQYLIPASQNCHACGIQYFNPEIHTCCVIDGEQRALHSFQHKCCTHTDWTKPIPTKAAYLGDPSCQSDEEIAAYGCELFNETPETHICCDGQLTLRETTLEDCLPKAQQIY